MNSQMETIHHYNQVENFFFLIPISLCEILLRLIDKVKQFEDPPEARQVFNNVVNPPCKTVCNSFQFLYRLHFSLCYNVNTTYFNSFVDQRFLGTQNCV
ncbi:hypothetical protein PRUPE_3G268900 [Prunus persica]|uniref:Uncharacterized protein n=1 Tax=Prunus persica TaxID=3760 RepID=A0A251Q9D8_PRUPE|nr:hypothetical protein PRUPE_3G268900 [Prunus persica]